MISEPGRRRVRTSIVEVVSAAGAGKGVDGWFNLTHSVVCYNHPHDALLEEAITIDFVNSALGPGSRVAVELTLEAVKELSGALVRVIAGAEIEESARMHGGVRSPRPLPRHGLSRTRPAEARDGHAAVGHACRCSLGPPAFARG